MPHRIRTGGMREPGCLSTRRRGLLLVVVLMIVSVLGLLGASFSYWMRADAAMISAEFARQQARLAAESGMDRAVLLLRANRLDMDEWYNNPDVFRRILVWSPDKIGGSESLADQEKIEGQPAWRFSIVSYEIQGEDTNIRYGLRDETSKLNLNTASRSQLVTLFEQIDLKENITPEELADALIDWVDSDDQPNSPLGAESGYYMTLNPPYRAKNRPLETVEELLSIRGFSGRVLYGEDYNRNGYLDGNEDDGPEGLFPPDDGDGVLDRGILPFVTVYTWDFNTGPDNKYKVNINAFPFSQTDKLPPHVAEELTPETIAFISECQNRRYKFKSVGELVGLEVYEDGTSNTDEMWREFALAYRRANQGEAADEEAAMDGGEGGDGLDEEMPGGTGDEEMSPDEWQKLEDELDEIERDSRDADEAGRELDEGGGPQEDTSSEEEDAADKDRRRRQQSIRDRLEEEGAVAGQGENDGDVRGRDRGERDGESTEEGGRSGRSGRSGRAGRDRDAGEEGSADENRRGRSGRTGRDRDNGGADTGSGERPGRGRDRAGRGRDRGDRPGGARPGGGTDGGEDRKGTPVLSPVTAEEMALLMDRLTTANSPVIGGLINVNTAPPEVLRTIPGLDEEAVNSIVSKRETTSGEEKMSPGWLLSMGALNNEKFAIASNYVTTRSLQYAVDVIGFADHTGAACRVQAVIEMRGQLAQVKYYRDISSLGLGYPVQDDQRQEGFSFDDR